MKWNYNEKSVFGSKISLESKTENTIIYRYKFPDGTSQLTLFQLFPGLYLVFNDIETHSLMQEQKVDLYSNLSALEYCISGAYEVELADHRKLYISEGDALFHSFGEKVIFSNLPTKKCCGITIILDFNMDFFELDQYLAVFGLTSQEIVTLFKQGEKNCVVSPSYDLKKMFLDLYLTDVSDRIRYYRLKVIEIFILMMERGKNTHRANFQLSLLDHVVGHMKRDLGAPLSIHQLAKEHGISLSALNHYFKDNYGMAPYQYLKQLRLEMAGEMLKTSQRQITDIASTVGFQNPSKFSEAFKECYKMSPTEYRKKHFRSK